MPLTLPVGIVGVLAPLWSRFSLSIGNNGAGVDVNTIGQIVVDESGQAAPSAKESRIPHAADGDGSLAF